jgi:hypothetical protein
MGHKYHEVKKSFSRGCLVTFQINYKTRPMAMAETLNFQDHDQCPRTVLRLYVELVLQCSIARN